MTTGDEITLIEIVIPGGSVVFNNLYANPVQELLLEDLLLVRLADGTNIDVGWHPQFDPEGHYKVVHYGEDWECPLERIYTRSLEEVVQYVQDKASLSSMARLGS